MPEVNEAVIATYVGGRQHPPDSCALQPLLKAARLSKSAGVARGGHAEGRAVRDDFHRIVKTQGSLPNEDAALVLLFSLVASGQIKLRRIDGGHKIGAVLSQHASVTA